jgi:hypothetical protein
MGSQIEHSDSGHKLGLDLGRSQRNGLVASSSKKSNSDVYSTELYLSQDQVEKRAVELLDC